jgi:hypothetical protein
MILNSPFIDPLKNTLPYSLISSQVLTLSFKVPKIPKLLLLLLAIIVAIVTA